MGTTSLAASSAALVLVAGAVASPAAAQQTHPDNPRRVRLKGRTVDEKGSPVADVWLCESRWFGRAATGTHGGQKLWPYGVGKVARSSDNWEFQESGPEGAFDVWIQPSGSRSKVLKLIAMTPDKALGAVWIGSLDSVPESLELVLRPTARLRARVSCRELGRDGVDAYSFLENLEPYAQLGAISVEGGFDIIVPPGRFRLRIYGGDDSPLFRRTQVFEFEPGSDVDLGEYDVLAKFWQRYAGRRPPPLQFESGRGLEPGERLLEQALGYWTVVDLVSKYTVENPGSRFDGLIRIDREWRESHAGEDPPFRVVQVVECESEEFEALEARLRDLGKLSASRVPHQVLFDPKGRTADAWRKQWLDTTLLLAPDGTVIRELVDVDEIAAVIDGEFALPLPARIGPRVLSDAEKRDPEWLAVEVSSPESVRRFLRLGKLPRDAAMRFLRSEVFNRNRQYLPPSQREALLTQVARGLDDLSRAVVEFYNEKERWIERAAESGVIEPVSAKDLVNDADRKKVAERFEKLVGELQPDPSQITHLSQLFMEACEDQLDTRSFRYRRFERASAPVQGSVHARFFFDPDRHPDLVELRQALDSKRRAFVIETAESMVKFGAMDASDLDRVVQYLCARFD